MRRLYVQVVMAAAVLVLVEAGSVARIVAQDAADWLRVDVVEVVPERLEAYVQLQINQVNPGMQQAGVPWRSVWRTGEFGNSYELQFVIPLGDLTDYDTGGPLARVMRPDRLKRLLDELRRSTVSRRVFVVQYRPELSVETDDLGSQFLARVSTIQIAPGRGGDWTAFLEKNRARFLGGGAVFGVYQRLFGPEPMSWQIVVNHASFAELVQPSIIARALGGEPGTAAEELAGVMVSVERTVLRYDPELSYTSIPSR